MASHIPKFVRTSAQQSDQQTRNSHNTLFYMLSITLASFMLFQAIASFSSSSSTDSSTDSSSLSTSSTPTDQRENKPLTIPQTHVRYVVHDHDPTHPDFDNLLVYNRPPGVASSLISKAMRRAFSQRSLPVSRCFKHSSNNEMTLRTVINREWVNFYGCQLKISKARYKDLLNFRGGNVTFMTSTTTPKQYILSQYLKNTSTTIKIASITNENIIHKHVQQYKQFVRSFPVGQLYDFHGADEDFELTSCPIKYEQMASLRRIVARYEIIIDLEKPIESANLVEIVTGRIKPDFTSIQQEAMLLNQNAMQSKLIKTLLAVDISNVTCGLDLVHGMLTQQFNLIKDRLLQNRCFDEDKGTFRLCDLMPLKKDDVIERTRNQSYEIKDFLSEELKRLTSY